MKCFLSHSLLIKLTIHRSSLIEFSSRVNQTVFYTQIYLELSGPIKHNLINSELNKGLIWSTDHECDWF